MNRIILPTFVAVVLGGIVFVRSAAAEWSMPNLNPFSQSSGGPPKTSSGSNWSLWPKSSGRSSQPSTLSKMTTGTTSAIKKTGQMLNPWHKEETPPSPTGLRGTSNRNNRQAKKETSWWSPWAEEEEPKPRTVAEFLKQPRPQ